MHPRRNLQRHRRNQRRHQQWLASFTYLTPEIVTHLALGAIEARLTRSIEEGFMRTYGDWQ